MKTQSIDTTYCFIDDAARNAKWRETYDSSDAADYDDPDRQSKRLYQDMLVVYKKRCSQLQEPRLRFESVVGYNIREASQSLFGEEGTRYASDFIGVNRKLAHMAGISDAEIVKYLEKQRTIGGHMLFPVGKRPTINQAKGCNMLDRFDFTLAELREYFIWLEKEKGEYQACFSEQLKTSFAVYKEWLKRFCIGKDGIANFKNFITYWMLDMFVSQDDFCKVISLAVSDLKNGRESYIEREGTEPYFPGLELFPKCVFTPKLKRVLSAMNAVEKQHVECMFTSYIKNTDFLIAQRNQMVEKMISSSAW